MKKNGTKATAKPAKEQGAESPPLEDKPARQEMDPEVLAALEAAEREGIQIC